MKNFLFALRYLRKLRGGTLARVVSLSLGLAVGLLVFSYANYNLTSDRCFPDRERIFQLWAHYADPQHSGYSPQLNAPSPRRWPKRFRRSKPPHACSGRAHPTSCAVIMLSRQSIYTPIRCFSTCWDSNR